MKTQRKPSKSLLKAQELFQQNVKEFIFSKGAKPTKDGHYDYYFDTPIGKLRITIYEDWIACRFEDIDAGYSFTTKYGDFNQDSNPYSGKWNFHYFGDVESLKTRSLINDFVVAVERLLSVPKSTKE